MKCPKCKRETNKTNGSSRGKPIYVCECGKKFTTEKQPFNDIDKWIACRLWLYRGYPLREIAEIIGCSLGTIHSWTREFRHDEPELPIENDFINHIKELKNGKYIADLFGVEIN